VFCSVSPASLFSSPVVVVVFFVVVDVCFVCLLCSCVLLVFPSTCLVMLLVPSPIFAFLSFSCPVVFTFPVNFRVVLTILVSSPFGDVFVCFPCSFVLIFSCFSSPCLTVSSGR
jgi:hypothetical protein